VTGFTASKVLIHAGHNSLPAVSVLAHGLLKVPALVFFSRGGTRTGGANGVAGTPRALATCATGPCNDSFRGASVARLVAGDYAAWLELSLTQPTATGSAFGFAVDFAVETGAGWVSITGYFSTGTTSARTGQVVHVDLLIDLGTTVLPTLKIVDETLALCGSTAGCP
jgi:hypothetical protein